MIGKHSGGKPVLWIAAAALLSIVILLLGIGIGSSFIPPGTIFSILIRSLFHLPFPQEISDAQAAIVMDLRLPRVVLAFLVGGGISLSGAMIQSVLNNPLASPYTLGVSSGASFGAGMVIVFQISVPILSGLLLPAAGLLAGILTVFGVVWFAKAVDHTMSNTTVVLTGMVFSLFFSSALTVLTAFSKENIQRITLWQMGSFAMRGWDYPLILLPFWIGCFFYGLTQSRELDILTFGDEQAASLGVNTGTVKRRVLIAASLMAGCCVSLSGVIGFVDLVSPHIARRLVGSRHGYVLPMSILVGGSFMVLADLAARILVPNGELPVGAVTAILGAPFFAYVFLTSKRKKAA